MFVKVSLICGKQKRVLLAVKKKKKRQKKKKDKQHATEQKENKRLYHFIFIFRTNMEWTEQHDNCLCQEILVLEPFKAKKGSIARGQLG